MRYFQSYLRKFLPLIVCASMAFNIFFITSIIGREKWISSNSAPLQPSQASEMIWPTPIGAFRVLFNYVPSVLKFNYTNSITFSTHATPDFLYHLEELAARWRGPISIAVYTPGSDVDLAIRIIRHLHHCADESVRNYVSFHLFFQQDTSNNQFEGYFSNYDSSVNCSWSIKELSAHTFRFKQNITYPVNAARNIARVLASTYYVLTCDLELYPSLDLIPMFLEMIQRRDNVSKSRQVYVLPVFEIEKDAKIPANKKELIQLVNGEKAVSFHRYLCKKCHQIPDEEGWLNTTSNNSLEIFSVAKRRPMWEPIFVGTNKDPLYDERLSWEGMADKMSQMYEMCLMDYQLNILDDAFLIHAPGIKKNWKKNLNWRKKHINNRLKVIKNIKAEIDARHPLKSNCKF